MKNKIVITLIFCSVFMGMIFSQNENQNKISGLGFLKINSSRIEVINEIEEKLNCVNKVINNSSKYFDFLRNNKQKPKYIIELQPDTNNIYNSPPRASECLKTRVFEIKGLIISNFEIEDLRLTFYDNILIEIHCDYNRDLVDGLKLKYGEGQKDIRTKKVTCTYKMNGNQVEYEENTIYETWENDDIITNAVVSIYYDDKCNKKYFNYITISSRQKSKLNELCEDETKANKENRIKQEKKKNLNDL